MRSYFSTASKLNGLLFNSAHRLRGVFSEEESFEHEMLTDEIYGACSFLLKGKMPNDVQRRLMRLNTGMFLVRNVERGATVKWSSRGRHAFFEVMMHAWVIQCLQGSNHPDMKLTPEVAEFEKSVAALITLVMQSFEKQGFSEISSDYLEPFLLCGETVMQSLRLESDSSNLEDAREAFAKLQPLFDSLWTNEPQDVALRGYLAGLGFCLSWLELQDTNL